MSDEVRSSGWMAILKSYLKQAYFSQYVTGFIAMLFILALITELPDAENNIVSITVYSILIIVMLFGNVWLGRESIRNSNLSHAAKIEAQRRDDPTVMQQMQASLARLENTYPAREDLIALKDATIRISNALDLQQDELVLSEDKQKLREQVKDLDKEINILVKEYRTDPDNVEPE